MTRVLVTGAGGFVGSAIVRQLRARDWDVVSVSRSPRAGSASADLLDDSAVRELCRTAGATHLVHAAWRPIQGDVMRSPDNLVWLKASLGLVQAFHDVGGQRVAVVGTSAEYDWSEGICRNNVTPLHPASLYGACKHALRVALEAYAGTVGLGFVWPRVFDAYGPGEHETRLVASVIRALLRGEPAACTHGMQVRDYLYIDDVAAGIVAALEAPVNGPIDIVRGEGIRVREVVLEIARQLGREDLVHFGARPAPLHDVALVVGDASEARTRLSWQPKFTLEQGIGATIAWERARRQATDVAASVSRVGWPGKDRETA